MRYAHIRNGTIVWERDYSEEIPEAVQRRKKIVPVVEEIPAHDPATEVLEGPQIVVEARRVVRRFTARRLTRDELVDAVRAARREAYVNELPDKGRDPLAAIADTMNAALDDYLVLRAWAEAQTPPPPPMVANFAAKLAIIAAIKARHPKP